jgi:glycerophosphoryl diester phosphodiesterase
MAHRGNSAEYPENSLQALEEAVALNVDVIESDLRLTKDNEMILFHDRKLNRTTNGKGSVKKKTLAELKKLDLGYWFVKDSKDSKKKYPFRGKGYRLSTLDEVLQKYPNMRFNFDIKDIDKKAPKILAKKLEENNAIERVMIGSFHHKQLKRFRKNSKTLTAASPIEVWRFRRKVLHWYSKKDTVTEQLSGEKLQKEIFKKKLPYKALQIPPRFSFFTLLDDPSLIYASHFFDIAVHVWTINNPQKMNELLDWNVDGIFTDKPQTLIEVMNKRNIL